MERNTRQRDAIRQVFVEVPRPLAPTEVLDFARQHVPSMGIATVYRTINALVESEWLIPVDLPGEAPRYERPGGDHHHHFSCRACDRLFESPGCPGDFQRFTPPGFVLESHEVVLYGLCARCHTA